MSVNVYDKLNDKLNLVAGGTVYADSPIGSIIPYGGTTTPSGWLLCNGQAISRTDYSELFAAIGTAFGSGDSSTTFNLPDLRETVPVGIGENGTATIAEHDTYTLGEFKDDQMQSHTHLVNHQSGSEEYGAQYHGVLTVRFDAGASGANTGRTGTTTHGKQLGVNYIIKAKQVAVPFDVAEYIRNQNILSAPEEVTLSNKQHTMEYDGIFTFSIYAYNASQRVKVSINNVLVINASLINYPAGQAYNSYTVQANKGDIITIDTTINLLDTITAQYYKLRDYTGR